MKRFLSACVLILLLSTVGCEFSKWALRTDPARPDEPPPAMQVVHETISSGLNGLETGGLVTAIAGAVFTFCKSGARIYASYKTRKIELAPDPQVEMKIDPSVKIEAV